MELIKIADQPTYKTQRLLRCETRECGLPMCEKCVEIDKNIERYRRIQRTIGDQVTIDRTKELIADLQAQKAALHSYETK
jgi:hypothetical protein